MTPEQAWKACCGQLQMEMPKAAFDTWVRDCEFLGYEDGLFQIGASTEYACAWLQSRLASTATRVLTGIMNRQVTVEFTVRESDTPIDPPYDETGQPTAAAEDGEASLRYQVVDRSLRESFVQPERVVMIPGYFKRWLPYLGPVLAWIVIAFRQVMYLATGSAARHRVEFAASPTAIARWAGIDRSTLWRRISDPPLGWFLSRDRSDNNRWMFRADMPLTPGDAEYLSALFIETGCREDPLAALDRMLALEHAALLPHPPPAPRPDQLERTPDPLSVQDLVLRDCSKLDRQPLKLVLDKADQLALRVMPPADRIFISHYFLLNWLSRLGAAPAWFVTLMRDRCYVTRQELRDDVWMWGGYPEIARLLGIQRPKTIGEWLPPMFSAPARSAGASSQYAQRQNRRNAKRDLLEQFLERQEYLEGDGFLAWHFKVNLLEPLIPEDQALYDQFVELLGEYLETGDAQVIEPLIRQAEEGASATHEGANATLPDFTKARLQRSGARLQQAGGAFATSGRRACNALNTLKHLLNHLKHSEEITTSTTVSDAPGSSKPSQVVVGETWDLERLLEQNRAIHAQMRRPLLENQASAQALVSWLLYAASPAGKSIRQPALFAASQLRQSPQRGAGAEYEQLAQLPPAQLLALLNAAIASPYHVSNAAWRQVMAEASSKQLLALRRQLFAIE
ncbi:MAG: DnaA N-terminal domain-containing protein [Chloroflexota bacterium]